MESTSTLVGAARSLISSSRLTKVSCPYSSHGPQRQLRHASIRSEDTLVCERNAERETLFGSSRGVASSYLRQSRSRGSSSSISGPSAPALSFWCACTWMNSGRSINAVTCSAASGVMRKVTGFGATGRSGPISAACTRATKTRKRETPKSRIVH
eukprot:scaffold138353_cov151-Phaeocystis_antarctica.AAC.1